jgi:hypothetical protein
VPTFEQTTGHDNANTSGLEWVGSQAGDRHRPDRRRPAQRAAYNLRKEPVVREMLDRIFRAHGML